MDEQVRRRKLYFLKLKESASLHNHIKTTTSISEELSVIGDSIDEEDRVVHLASLPDSYNMLVIALKASQYVPKWALVNEHLLFKETKIKERDSSCGTELKVMTSKQLRKDPSVITVEHCNIY